MRPLPIAPVAGRPAMILGISIVRGVPVPVVDFAALFGASGKHPSRLVIVRAGQRRVAFTVDDVLGIHRLPHSSLTGLPPLLQGAVAGALETISTLDQELLFVLGSSSIVPEKLWETLAVQEP